MPVFNKVGGGRKPFAFIIATYPEGSTCTCTNSFGYSDVSSTQRVFYISDEVVPFTCTVSCTDGTELATKTETISSDGQSVSVSLYYKLYIVKNGVFQEGYSFVNAVRSGRFFTTTQGEGYANLVNSSSSSRIANVANTFDLTNYKTLVFDIETTSTASYFGLSTAINRTESNPNQFFSYVATAGATTRKTISINIENATTNLYVGCGVTTDNVVIKIYSAYLEAE